MSATIKLPVADITDYLDLSTIQMLTWEQGNHCADCRFAISDGGDGYFEPCATECAVINPHDCPGVQGSLSLLSAIMSPRSSICADFLLRVFHPDYESYDKEHLEAMRGLALIMQDRLQMNLRDGVLAPFFASAIQSYLEDHIA